MSGIDLPPFVLASTSVSRRAVLAELGVHPEIVPPQFDERSLDERFDDWGPERYVAEVACGKWRSVADGWVDERPIVAADQIAVLNGRLLVKPSTEDEAVEQLLAMAGGTHELINALVIGRVIDSNPIVAVDRHLVTMAAYDEPTARAYVVAAQPFDSVGGYRIEDDAGLLAGVVGSGDDGVRGLPVALLGQILNRLASDR